jgi:uncharacterized cupin superfamily protein
VSTTAGILTADARRDDLGPCPITPAHVLSGAPVARSAQLTASGDGRISTHLWDCTAGSFHWFFAVDEIVHILDGEVHVTGDDGNTVILRTGDVGHFPLHSHTVWHVPDYVRKLAFHRAHRPSPLPLRAVRKLRRMLVARGTTAAAAALPLVLAPPF